VCRTMFALGGLMELTLEANDLGLGRALVC
jgi:hypothetical protein